MLRYVFLRLLSILPTLFFISLVAFFLSTIAPGDPVEDLLHFEDATFEYQDPADRQTNYFEVARQLGRDKPLFYFSVRPVAVPDTLYRIIRQSEREAMRALLSRHGSWHAVNAYRESLYQLQSVFLDTPEIPGGTRKEALNLVAYALISSDPGRVKELLQQLERLARPFQSCRAAIQIVRISAREVLEPGDSWRLYMPKLVWYGTPNQYHQWLGRVLDWDFGISLRDGRPVGSKISEAVRWTLMINIPALCIAFLLSIPLGVATARRKGQLFDRISNGLLLALFAMPSFWLATLCVVFFTTSEYGAWTDWFPSPGLGDYRIATSSLQKTGILLAQLALPVICLSAGSLAYLTRQMRKGILTQMREQYILAARARGIPENRIYWNHAFRNALLPMITIFASAVPASISGSVIIEVIFGIPGMGFLLYSSIVSKDWNVVFAMLLISGFLTVIGYLLGDILYRWSDPRIKLGSR